MKSTAQKQLHLNSHTYVASMFIIYLQRDKQIKLFLTFVTVRYFLFLSGATGDN